MLRGRNARGHQRGTTVRNGAHLASSRITVANSSLVFLNGIRGGVVATAALAWNRVGHRHALCVACVTAGRLGIDDQTH